MMYKLIFALYVVSAMTVEFSTTHPVDNQETGILVEWNKPHQFCGTLLEELIKEICKGEMPEDWKNHLNTPLSTKCCVSKCSASELKQQYCKDKSSAGGLYINGSKKNKTINKRDTTIPVTTTAPQPQFHPSNWHFFQTFMNNLIFRPRATAIFARAGQYIY